MKNNSQLNKKGLKRIKRNKLTKARRLVGFSRFTDVIDGNKSGWASGGPRK